MLVFSIAACNCLKGDASVPVYVSELCPGSIKRHSLVLHIVGVSIVPWQFGLTKLQPGVGVHRDSSCISLH